MLLNTKSSSEDNGVEPHPLKDSLEQLRCQIFQAAGVTRRGSGLFPFSPFLLTKNHLENTVY